MCPITTAVVIGHIAREPVKGELDQRIARRLVGLVEPAPEVELLAHVLDDASWLPECWDLEG